LNAFEEIPASRFLPFPIKMIFAVSRPIRGHSLTAAFLSGAIVFWIFSAGKVFALSQATMTIQVGQPGALVSSNLFGVFFEEINYAGDGGIYGEMVRNRSFAESSTPDFWTVATTGTATGAITIDRSSPLNINHPASLNLTMSSGSGSVAAVNAGYWGMPVKAGSTYNLNFYARCSTGYTGPIQARLQNSNGSITYAQALVGGLSTAWQHFNVSLAANDTDTNAQLSLSIFSTGTIWFSEVSLFPQATFNNRTNGLRSDLANLVAGLKPSFMRYPGGNFIESFNVTNAVRWKKTIGDIASRPGHWNDSWGYWSTDGYGLDEGFRQCEDMGMEMLYGINAGLCLGYNGSTNNTVPLDQMGPWVQDALDLIQYANGETTTTWGAARAANGHPAPYNLQYMEIGNENGGPYLNDRYALFYDAIKSNYPSVHLIASGGNWAGGPPWSRPVEIVDEHYYSDPGTFISYATKYDSYSRTGPKIFVGEYAVTSGYGTYGNLAAALGEASFMTGMERNSDLVLMASYAPLFGNVNSTQWRPDLIYFNGSQAFGTPSYYVQQMFSLNRGDTVLPSSVVVSNDFNVSPHGTIGLGSWNTAVQYTNIVVSSNGTVLYQSDFVHQGTNGWSVFNGVWNTNAGLYQQSTQTTDCYSTYLYNNSTNWGNYTVSLQARKTGGAEGFLILFNAADNNNWTWWNIGGWYNTQAAIERTVAGSKTTYAQVSQTIGQNIWYFIRIVVTGSRAQCYLGTNAIQAATNLVQDVTLPAPAGGFAASATFSRTSGQIIIKAVNAYSTPMPANFNMSGVNSIAPSAQLIQLTSFNATDENSFAAPTYVSPVTNSISSASTNFTLTLPANSLSILRLTAARINSYTNLLLQVPSPLTNDISVASTVWGEQSGTWVNLTTNSNHAIQWSSADTNIAIVDMNGTIAGVHSGTTSVIAAYPALGLTATQTVRVIFVPPTLAHRYSFSETNGSTTIVDSVGGQVWNGTLPNGGTLANGQLSFASASQQFLSLPGGILSNYTAATIEMWIPGISGMTTSPPFDYLFAFGNTDANGKGYNYIFFNPNFARAAISATDPGFNGEQGGNLASSLGVVNNLHLTCVFDPPAGVINVYTNGILASSFNGITDPLSIVGNQFAYIGRSLYGIDSYLTWTIDELRIYNGALSASEAAATEALGPNQLLATSSPAVGASALDGELTLNWPLSSAGYTVLFTTNLASGSWDPAHVKPQIINGQWTARLPLASSQQFYRLGK